MNEKSKDVTPDWLAVALDEAEERGPEAWVWGWVNADAKANAAADANASAAADAYADANASAAADAYAGAYADAYAGAYANAAAAADANASTAAYAGAYASAAADAYAYANTHANADAYASADAEKQPPQLSTKGLTVRPGLYLYTSPSSDSVAVLRVAWLRRVPGNDPHEYEALNSTTPLRGEYTTLLAEAQDAPPPGWQWSPMLKRPSPIHRAQIRNPVALDEKGYATVCPRPKDWDEVTR